ncbi:MAG: hypothetical protein ABIR59_13640 [Gemmatimonadales bacterium]
MIFARVAVRAMFLTLPTACAPRQSGTVSSRAPAVVQGTFVDDYGQRYSINDTIWQHGSASRYHVMRWDTAGMFAIAQNDSANPGDGNKWTRIDWTDLAQQSPYTWGYCYTAYEAESPSEARDAIAPDRANPRTGCNGFPFTRMRAAR